eukprot:322632_1
MPPRGGGIETTTKTNADAIQQNLKRNGVPSTLEKKQNGNWVINYILSFKQLVFAEKLVTNLKNDQKVDAKDMKMDDSIAAKVVDIDLKLAMKQTPNVKFSYIDNKISPEKGLKKLQKYKIQDLDKMDDFFEKVDPIQSSRCCNPDDDAKQLISDHDDEIEKWWFQQTEQLKHNIEVQFTNSEEEYELVGINLLYNSKHATKYLQFKGYENSVLMFHGARQEDMGSIFKTGFRFSSKSIGSLYGKGHYFTPQALHAIRYLYTCKGYSNQEQFALIAAFVNPGKIKTVKGKEYRNQPIAKGYDSHYAQVTDGTCANDGIGHPVYPNYKGDVMEEYAIKEPMRILPRFYITLKRLRKVFIWRDKNIANQFNGCVLKELRQSRAIYGVTTTQTAIDLIKKKQRRNKVYVITNGAHDGEGFVRKVRNSLKFNSDILVFCNAVDWHSKWANKFQKIQVKSGRKHIMAFVANH